MLTSASKAVSDNAGREQSSCAELLEPSVRVDEVRLFMLYTMFGGDTARVALVSRVEKNRIDSLAHDFRWKQKLGGHVGLSTDKGAEEERAVNRVANYVTAERLRRVFDRLIDELDSDPAFAKAFCTVVDDETEQTKFSTKNLTDLAKGLQIVNDITYRALQDKQAQAADVVNKAVDATSLALATYKALASRFDKMPIVDATLEISKAVSDARCTPDT
jgi:hypothetical protein